jgi:hypothetical protein
MVTIADNFHKPSIRRILQFFFMVGCIGYGDDAEKTAWCGVSSLRMDKTVQKL